MSLFNSKLDRKSSTPLLFSNSMDSTTLWYAPGVIARKHAFDAKLPDILRPTALEVLRKLGKRRTPDKRSLGLNGPKKAKKKGLIFIQISQWRLKSPSPQKSPPPQIRPQQGYLPSPMHPKTNLRQAQLRPNPPRIRADPLHHLILSTPHLFLLAIHLHGNSVIRNLELELLGQLLRKPLTHYLILSRRNSMVNGMMYAHYAIISIIVKRSVLCSLLYTRRMGLHGLHN